ncbi:MAG: DNA mismatch repair endonuclease MutL [Candidatus Omnitrophota bacterium]
MPKVRLLPADVIAKIAAGEVVDRPASVVKELMENSLDAGATRIEVHLTGGGKQLIQIRDNGSGIAREDLDSLFARHATSKIRTNEDLDSILSLGFRGEALYSVSSVAELTLKSRAAGANDAWEVKVRGGEKQAPVPAAMPSSGTDIKVEEIFFNTPARKKFLKSDTTEFDQTAQVFLPYALLYPDKHFILTHNGRGVYDLPPEETGAPRAARALALKAEHIITLDRVTQGDITISALLGDINIARPRRDLQFVFVNGRPVQSKGLLFHLNDVYRLIMPEGLNPFFVFFLEIPPSEVDVNIHPAKREVRIKDEGRVGSMIRRSVEQALMTRGGPKEVKADIFSFEPGVAPEPAGFPPERMVFSPGPRSAASPAPDFFSFTEQVAAKRDDTLKDRLSRARFIGTFIRKYHLFEEGDGLFAVDQHAAQERIMFELFSAQMASGKMEVERLLTPIVVRLAPREILLWESVKEQLDGLGFESALMGEGAVALQAYPRLIKAPEAAFRSLIADEVKGLANKDILARRACRASVMTGENMHGDEAREQLKRLLACADPFTCPHGRPVFIELKTSFLDRQFLRV